MTDLCFAEFARCIQSAMQPPNEDKSVVEVLLGWITQKNNVLDRKGNPINLAPSLVSDLLNRKVDVPKAIREECSTAAIISEAVQHCANKVLPCLNPVLRSDMFQAMGDAVDSDDKLATKQKKKLGDLLNKEEEAEFLGWLLIYVINRENRVSDAPLISEDIPLLAEASYECPICRSPLITTVKNTSVKKYEIVKIYPDEISAVSTGFENIPPPHHPDAPDNRIALCLKHAEEYQIEPTVKEYRVLKEIKERLSSAYSLRIDINDSALENEIQSVLHGLAEITDETTLEELPLDALRLDQKILPENHLLKNDETTRVLRYYHFIDDCFSAMDRDGTGCFELIASEVKVAYMKLANGQLTQEETVNQLAEWIRTKAKVGQHYLRACHIVVAYFIQNCEVFSEIPK